MSHPPLTRHPALQPLSRDHYVGLVQAQHLLRAAQAGESDRRAALADFRTAWQQDISVHFMDEERLLVALIPEPTSRERLLDEHARLRNLASRALQGTEDPDPDLLRQIGQLLNDHIRWEERHLFPAIEETAGQNQLANLQETTSALELSRPRSACGLSGKARE